MVSDDTSEGTVPPGNHRLRPSETGGIRLLAASLRQASGRRKAFGARPFRLRALRPGALSGKMTCGLQDFATRQEKDEGCCLAQKMKIALAADHAGFDLKEKVRSYLQTQGFDVEDFGPAVLEPVDYPDFAEKVAVSVAAHHADYGILVCGTGLGMMLAANKVPGIRAVPCNDTLSAHFARAHNNGNVLTLGGRMLDEAAMHNVVDTWLSTPFEGGRHGRRVEKINAIDQRHHGEKKE